MKHQQFRM